MRKKDYELIASCVHRTSMVMDMDKNQVRKQAKRQAINLLVIDLAANLAATNPLFDKTKFYQACGQIVFGE